MQRALLTTWESSSLDVTFIKEFCRRRRRSVSGKGCYATSLLHLAWNSKYGPPVIHKVLVGGQLAFKEERPSFCRTFFCFVLQASRLKRLVAFRRERHKRSGWRKGGKGEFSWGVWIAQLKQHEGLELRSCFDTLSFKCCLLLSVCFILLCVIPSTSC